MLVKSYVGNNAIGASTQTPNSRTVYLTPATIPAGSILSRVEGYMNLTDDSSISFRVAVYLDDDGAPGLCIGTSPQPQLNAINVGGTDRWFGAAVSIPVEDET